MVKFRKIGILVLVIIVLLSVATYLRSEYNSSTIEIDTTGYITKKSFEKFPTYNDIENYTINYSKPYGDLVLVMTIGDDLRYKNIPILHGDFIKDTNKMGIVLGDKAADYYFRIENPIGATLKIMDKKYEVIGVVKDSNHIYIPYDEELAGQSWDKTRLRLVFKYEKLVEAKTLQVVNSLRKARVHVNYYVIYNEVIHMYYNMVILILIYMLFKVFKKLFNKTKTYAGKFNVDYQKEKRSLVWFRNIMKNYLKLLITIGYGVISLGLLYFMIRGLSWISLPAILKPDNILSFTSWADVFKNVYNLWIVRMQQGHVDFLLDVTKLNIIMLVIIIGIILRENTLEKKNLLKKSNESKVIEECSGESQMLSEERV